MNLWTMIKKPSAFLPVSMSLAAIAVIVIHVALFGVARQADEGTSAHLWQLLMAGQMPIILFFAATSLPRNPRQSLLVLALQIGAAFAAAFPVFYFNW
jgi:hypothetical protein